MNAEAMTHDADSPDKWAAQVEKKIGNVEARGADTMVLACLLAFMRWKGFRGRLINVLGIAPMTPGSEAALRFAARRLGIALTRHRQQQLPCDSAALFCWPDGHAVLALIGAGGPQKLFDPSAAQKWQDRSLPTNVVTYVLEVKDRGRWDQPPPRPPRLWLIDYCPQSTPLLDMTVISALSRKYAAAGVTEQTPDALEALTIEALLASHRSMAPQHPDYFGCLRTINIRQYSVFIDAIAVPRALEALFATMSRHTALTGQEILPFSAKILTDFLTIHPFLNGNRRMGVALVTTLLRNHGLQINWEGIGIAAFYYCMRCAARGHFGPLLRVMRTHLSRVIQHG